MVHSRMILEKETKEKKAEQELSEDGLAADLSQEKSRLSVPRKQKEKQKELFKIRRQASRETGPKDSKPLNRN